MYALSQTKPRIRDAHYMKLYGEQTDFKRMGYCYAFHLNVKGHGTFIIDNKKIHVRPGNLIFIPPKITHSIYIDHNDPLHLYNIYCELWDNKDMSQHNHLCWNTSKITNPTYLTQINHCKELEQFPTLFDLNKFPFLLDMFSHIVQLCDREAGMYTQHIISGLLYNWLLELYEGQTSPIPFDYRINRILNLMEDDVAYSISYRCCLSECGMEKSQFFNLFKKMTGQSPKKYMLKLKMKHAGLMLLESDQKVTEISEKLGYQSVHYFTRQFTKYFGEPPTSYRQKGAYRLK